MTSEYTLFAKGYVDLATESPAEDVAIEFERAASGERYKWQTRIRHKTFTPRKIAEEMYRRLEEAQDPDDPDPKMRTVYTEKFPVDRLEQIVKASLTKLGAKEATESMKQKFLQSLGTLRRKESEAVRYTPIVDRYLTLSTRQRQSDSVSAAELRSTKTIFYTDQTRASLVDEQVEFFVEVIEPGSGFKCVPIGNRHDFKTPLNTRDVLSICSYNPQMSRSTIAGLNLRPLAFMKLIMPGRKASIPNVVNSARTFSSS